MPEDSELAEMLREFIDMEGSDVWQEVIPAEAVNWLNEYVEVPSDLKAFCDRLDLTGTGVEGV